MTDMQREALAVLAEVSDLSPEVRLGHLMVHLASWAKPTSARGDRLLGRGRSRGGTVGPGPGSWIS
jgi:hypothetical protein